MKNLLTYLIVVLFTLFSYSCNRQRTTRMTIEDNNRFLKIEYAGNMYSMKPIPASYIYHPMDTLNAITIMINYW